MNEKELREFVKNGESSKVEFKTEDVHPNSLAEEIVSFCNFEGGIILIGIDDGGDIIGCERKDMEEFVINVCRNNVRPALIPVVEKVVVDGKSTVVVSIPKADTPCSTNKGLYFIRVGTTKQVPTQLELLRLFQKKNVLQFDETPVLKAGPRSIDLDKIDNYLEKLGQSPVNRDDDDLLVRELLNLSVIIDVDDGYYPSLGALLAFGKNPQKYFPSYTIMCGAYDGDDATAPAIREKELSGSLDEIIEDAMAFYRFTVAQDHSLENESRRRDRYAYPMEALREGIVNAICHRDYTISGSAIRIFVYKNSCEIRSPGGLPNTLTLESMHYRQFTRNQMIASYLAGYGYMEKRGKGLLKMKKLCREYDVDCSFYLSPDDSEFIVKMDYPM